MLTTLIMILIAIYLIGSLVSFFSLREEMRESNYEFGIQYQLLAVLGSWFLFFYVSNLTHVRKRLEAMEREILSRKPYI